MTELSELLVMVFGGIFRVLTGAIQLQLPVALGGSVTLLKLHSLAVVGRGCRVDVRLPL